LLGLLEGKTAVALTESTDPPSGRNAAAAIKDRILLGQTNWKNIGSQCERRVQNKECDVIVECTTVVLWVPDDLLNGSILEWQRLRPRLRVPFSGPYLKPSLVGAITNKSAQ
jgi:hypothetical protein